MFAGVGERTREGNDLYHEMIESGVNKEGRRRRLKVRLVFGQMNEPPGARPRRLTGLTVAEHFRDQGQKGRAVLRRQHPASPRRARKCRRCSAAFLRRWAISRRSRPTWAPCRSASPRRPEGLDHLGAGHLRAGRRLDRPGAGHLVRPLGRDHGAVARDRRSASIRRSIRSTRRRACSTAAVVGEEHYDTARRVQETLQRYKSLQDIIAILGMDERSSPTSGKFVSHRRHRETSGQSSTANTTTCPRLLLHGRRHRRSRMKKARSWPRKA